MIYTVELPDGEQPYMTSAVEEAAETMNGRLVKVDDGRG